MRYPAVRRDGTVESLHGESIADPYRWLEDGESSETRAFIEAQNAFAEPILAALPARSVFRDRVAALLLAPTRGCPFERGGRVFAWQNDGQNQDVLVVADDVEGLERGEVVLDPNTLSADGTVAVTMASVSPDGQLLAYGVADGGSDWRTIRVRDLVTGADLDDALPWTKWNSAVWMPGGRAFSYWAYDAPSGDALTDEQGAGRLLVHELGTDPADDALLWERPEDPRRFARHWPRDDEWFVLSTDTGSSSGNDLAVRRHDEPADALRQLVTGHDHEWHAIGIRDGRLFAVTDDGAPRYRLAAFDLATGRVATVVPEHPDDVLTDAALTASGLVLEYSHDASHRMHLATDDGELGDEVPLGEGVSIVESHASEASSVVYAATSSFVDRGTRHVIEVDGARLVAHRSLPAPGPTAPAATTERIRVRSSDGATVPAFVVRPAAVERQGPRPTLIWGYGGFNIPMHPGFRAVLAAWVDAGGTLVVPNLRGGGEFGSEWHKAGTKSRKQQVFDDLFAVAEHLIATGETTREQLALHGRSNGGLLAGAALTQRPELWAAVLPGVGVLDMLRFHRFTIGWAWTSDYGDPDDADDFAFLRAYSPLHAIRTGIAYPPTLITTGDHDDRVVPAHSFKFAAALQHAQSEAGAPAPIVLSIDTRAGHGAGKPRDAAALEFADQLAFAAHYTGLDGELVPADRSGAPRLDEKSATDLETAAVHSPAATGPGTPSSDAGPAITRWETEVAALWDRHDDLDRDAAVAAMRELAEAYPGSDGRAAFELAGMLDSHGFEHEAEREYERALDLGLQPEHHAQLAVQYGSTLRNTGRIDDAIAVLEAAPEHPSTGSAPRVFLALALHSAGREAEALRVAIEALEPTLPRYRQSVRAYAESLTSEGSAAAVDRQR